MGIVKECDELLADTDLVSEWVKRLLEASDKLSVPSEMFSFLLPILLDFGELDEQINDLKSRGETVRNVGEQLDQQWKEVEQKLAERRGNVEWLKKEIAEIEEREEQMKKEREDQIKATAKEKDLYTAADSTIKGKLDDIVPLTLIKKPPTGHVRQSRCRSLGATVCRVVRNAGAAVHRSLSRGLRIRMRPGSRAETRRRVLERKEQKKAAAKEKDLYTAADSTIKGKLDESVPLTHAKQPSMLSQAASLLKELNSEREERKKKLAEKGLYTTADSTIKSELDDIVPMRRVKKPPTGHVRQSRCRSLSATVCRAVRNAGTSVRRSLSRGFPSTRARPPRIEQHLCNPAPY